MAKHNIKANTVQLDKLEGNNPVIESDKPIRQTGDFSYENYDLVPKWLVQYWISQLQVPDGVVVNGGIDTDDFDNGNITLGLFEWRLTIAGSQQIYGNSANVPFTGIPLSGAGLVRYNAFFGDDTGSISMISGVEGTAATLPDTPDGTVLLGYVLITDAGADSPIVPDNGVNRINGLGGVIDIISGDNVTVEVVGQQIIISSTGGGGGAVDSVNGQTGVVSIGLDSVAGFGATTNTPVGLGSAAGNARVTMGANTASIASFRFIPSTIDWTGTDEGAGYIKGKEIYIFLDGSLVNILKSQGNEVFEGVGNRVLETNADGDTSATSEKIIGRITDLDIIDDILAATWTDNEADIAGVKESQFYYSYVTHFKYEAVADGKMIRR